MKRLLTRLIVLSAFALLTLPPVLAAPPPRLLQAVALVGRRNPENGRYLPVGTAFHVGGGVFRTAAHVAESHVSPEDEGKGYDEWALYLADEFGNPRRLLGRSVVACVDRRWARSRFGDILPHDSATFQLVSGQVPPETLSVSARRPTVGDAVSIWGFPEGVVLFEVNARVTTVSHEWIQLREQPGAPSLGGHSGSPLIDMTGGVVGILVAGVTGVGETTSAVPIWDAETACPRP